MLSTSNQVRLKDILQRVAKGEEVNLQERIYLGKLADQNPTIETCLRRAKRMQQNQTAIDKIDLLLNDLDLGASDPQSSFKPKIDDLGEWFSGAPSWIARS